MDYILDFTFSAALLTAWPPAFTSLPTPDTVLQPANTVMAVTAMAVYPNPQHYALTVGLVALVFAAVNIPSVSTWAGFGSALREWLSVPVRLKWFNITMAVLLVLSLWPMLK